MKILFACSVLPINGGVATFVDIISKKLRQVGIGAEVITVTSEKQDSFKYIKSYSKEVLQIILNSDLVFLALFFIARKVLFLRFLQSCRAGCPNIVHAQDINAFNALYKPCEKRNIKIFLNVHGHLYNSGTATRKIGNGSWLSRYLLRQEIKAYKLAERIITVSDYSRDFISSYTSRSKIIIIRNFVNTDEFFAVQNSKKLSLRQKLGMSEAVFIVIYAGGHFHGF